MKQTFSKTWPLFFGLGMMMIANGLQGTLLGLRASIEDFSVLTTGLIMSSYYFGFLAGSLQVPKIISQVGHIRVFAALASVASTAVLLHAVFVDPVLWFGIRAITGFSYAGLYLVVESWLNDAATNKTRGKIMGVYMVVTFLGMALGQALLNVGDPSQVELFVIVSVLVSLALVPISLSRRPAPDFTVNETIALITIWKRSPLGVFGTLLSGLTSAAIFSIGPIYAISIGMSTAAISGFMASFIMGAVIFSMPVAWISDHMDRRKMIIILGAFSGIVACGLLAVSPSGNIGIFVVMAMLGGISMPIYSQCISHVNDNLLSRQFVAATGTLLMLNGLGAAIGPLLVTGIMQLLGNHGYAVLLIVSYGAIGVFGFYRTFRNEAIPQEDQSDTILMPARGSSVQIYTDD